MPRRTTRGSACASGGAGAAVTSKLDATARWSEPQGTPTSTSGPPGSPTSRLASVVAGPVTVTQSIRSSVSRRRMRGGGVPAVHVSPGRSTGSGCASRYESRNPASARAADTGQRSGYFTCGLHGSHGGRPVQVRRGVEVAGEERRHAAGALPGQRAEVRADLAEPRLALVLQHLGRTLAVAHQLRPVRARRQVHVGDCHHPARADRDVAEAHPAALHRIDRVVRDQVQRLVRVGHPRRVRDAPEIALGLLDPHHVRTRRPDRLADPVELNLSAAVPDVEGHHGERVGRGRGCAHQQRERGGERGEAPHRSTSASRGRGGGEQSSVVGVQRT